MRYLESALINLAKKVGRVSLENVASPTGGAPLPEADASNMDVLLNSWAEATKVQHATRQELRSKLFADGALRSEGAVAVATRDIVFSSPSAASATALGKASSNGRIEWKTQDGQTFSAWEQSVG